MTVASTAAIDPVRRRRWAAGFLAVLAAYAAVGVFDVRSASRRLEQARADLDETREKLAEIREASARPKVASLQAEQPAEITNRIDHARRSAGLPESAMIRVLPGSPQRIGRSDFELRATEIELASATLPKLVRFIEALSDEETGSKVRDVRIGLPESMRRRTGNGTPDRQKAQGEVERWKTEMTLTQMIFSPTSR